MLGFLFGWRKAFKCKKLIKRVQVRLKLMKIKRSTTAKESREDIAKLLRDGHDQIAFNKLEQLYLDENMKEVYELLDSFCEFVLINLSYIKRHRDCPNDVKEAVSSLIFTSARLGDLPELLLIRKLFGEQYGHKFATAAVELHPGNLVNPQMKDKLCLKSVTEFAKNRLLDEIIRECFFKPSLLAVEYSPSPIRQQASEDAECNDTAFMFPASEYPEQSIVYLDEIEEFKSPARKDDEQDQRMFIFKPLRIQKAADQPYSRNSSGKKSARKRQRRRSSSKECKQHLMNDNGFKHQKKIQEEVNLAGEGEHDGLGHSFRFWLKEEEPETPSGIGGGTLPSLLEGEDDA